VKPKEKEFKEGINKCEEVIKQLEINSTTTQTQINQLFNSIRIKLDEKEQELLNQLVELEKFKKKELELQKEELKFGIESIIGSCQIIKNSLSLPNCIKNNIQLISMKKFYHSRLDYLRNNSWRIEPHHHSFIEFFSFDNGGVSIYSTISNIGAINSNDISAGTCFILRNENQKIVENEEFVFEIIGYSKIGNEMKTGGNRNKFNIQIEGESNKMDDEEEEKYEWKIIDLNNGTYEVKMKLKSEGKYSIFVQCEGIDINSSPFHLQIFPQLRQRNYHEINQPKLTFGSQGNGYGQFSGSYGITTDSNRNIIVGDYSNHRIQIFDSEGNFIFTFGSKGNGHGELSYPFGITTNSKGNIIVSDCHNNRIQIFDSQGNFLLTFGSRGNGDGQFNSPRDVRVDLNDNIYVCDSNNNRIQVFNSEGRLILMFGSKGNDFGQFNSPMGLAMNSMGNLIVNDFGNNRIQVFDSKGNFIYRFGEKGNGYGHFSNSYGVCVDINDNILVCDYGNNRIQIFDSFGAFMTQFGTNRATAVTIDPKTQDIITCGNDHKVLIY